jgi:DNA primase
MRTDGMAARYDREAWSRRANAVRERLPVSHVVGRVVALKKAGAELVGLCPFHDERTPSFTVNDRKQFFHCFGCGQHGDAIAFVMARQGLAFQAAVELLEAEGGLRHLQAARPAAPPPKAEQREDLGKAEFIARLWAQCRHDPVVHRYLEGRALAPPASYGLGDPDVNGGWPADLRFHPALYHSPTRQALPAMVAAFRRGDGSLAALHRTYLKISGVAVGKAGTGQDKMHLGERKGAAIRLGPAAERMLGGEGIETTLAAMQLYKRAGLAFGSADAMAAVEPPFECSDFLYAADWNARNRTGEKAAWKGTHAFGKPMGRTVSVKVPNLRDRDSADFNDVMVEKARIAALPSPFARAVASQKARGIEHGPALNVIQETPADGA